MWYRKSSAWLDGIIPTEGAEQAPSFDNASKKDSANFPYGGKTLEGALSGVRSSDSDATMFDNDGAYEVHYGNSAKVADAYNNGPGLVPKNKPNIYTV